MVEIKFVFIVYYYLYSHIWSSQSNLSSWGNLIVWQSFLSNSCLDSKLSVLPPLISLSSRWAGPPKYFQGTYNTVLTSLEILIVTPFLVNVNQKIIFAQWPTQLLSGVSLIDSEWIHQTPQHIFRDRQNNIIRQIFRGPRSVTS